MNSDKPEIESEVHEGEELIAFDDSYDNPVNEPFKRIKEWAEENYGPQELI
jgi:hypothetical protein